MRRHLLQRSALGLPVLAVAMVLAACASGGAPAHLHSLMPAELAPRTAAANATPIVVAIEPIRLPAQVDQPQWLVRLPDGSLASLEQERWASPLRDEFRQALVEELAAHAGVVESRSAVAGVASPTRVGVDVRRFDSLPGKEARIEGSWTLQTGAPAATAVAAPPIRCEWLLREPAPGGLPELAAAHRRALVRLADGIGDGLVALGRGGSVACPTSDPR